MSFSTLKPEIWTHILEYLAPSLPMPLSGLTQTEAVDEPKDVVKLLPLSGDIGVTERTDIRSRELAALMRTSLQFNQLASRPLYRSIICDDYPNLVNHIKSPRAHPQVENSAELLSLTRSLHLEYSQKSHATYVSIMSDPRYWGALSELSRKEVGLALASIEAENFYKALYNGYGSTRDPAMFPNITRLTCGAIFGGQDGLWEQIANNLDIFEARAWVSSCRRVVIPTFEKSPISFLCQRGYAGPLSFPQAFHWEPYPDVGDRTLKPSPTFTIHYNTNSEELLLPAAVGHRTRWILDHFRPAEHFDHILQGITESVENIQDCLGQWDDPYHCYGELKQFGLDIEAYGSTTGVKSPGILADRFLRIPDFRIGSAHEKRMMEDAKWLLGKGNIVAKVEDGPEDKISWRAFGESPCCESCGWSKEQAMMSSEK